jgi:hypothetical protein
MQGKGAFGKRSVEKLSHERIKRILPFGDNEAIEFFFRARWHLRDMKWLGVATPKMEGITLFISL